MYGLPSMRASWGMDMKKKARTVFIVTGAGLVLGVFVWQGIVFSGMPDPAKSGLSVAAAILSSAVLVFREGLEAILVLSATLATVTRKQQSTRGKWIAVGAGVGLFATMITWFIVVQILDDINLPELDIQAATGLLAILVVLVVMNWFFHKIYWTGWIKHHTNRGRELILSTAKSASRMYVGFLLLGFTAIYREGFEVVLFLQQLRLRDGTTIVLTGAAIGALLTGIIGVLTFIAHRHLAFKKMLVLTGELLGGVLLVMVGESVQEMQQTGWISLTPVRLVFPGWLGMWFAVFPNWEGLLAQAGAALLVLGSYVSAQHLQSVRPAFREQDAGL